MRIRWFASLCLVVWQPPGLAYTLTPAHAVWWSTTCRVAVAPSRTREPSRGASTMTTVEKQFGAPATRHPTVGKPPITRWDYPNFSVFFEGDRVIDTRRDRQLNGAAHAARAFHTPGLVTRRRPVSCRVPRCAMASCNDPSAQAPASQ
jgi:hypothetical protein